MDDITTVPRPTGAAVTPPRWAPSARELDDAEALLLGAYPGVSGFLGPDDLAAVRAHARLADGTPWPVEVSLAVPAAVAGAAGQAGSVVLLDEEGTPVAEVRAERLWDLDGGRVGVAGPVAPLAELERGSHRSLRTPAADSARPGPVLGIALDRPPHAPQLAQWVAGARSLGASVRLLPLTGSGRGGPVDGPALVRVCLDAAARIGAAGIGADVIPVSVPLHGDADRDRLAGALVAGAYGATHVPGPLPSADTGWSRVLPAVVELGEVVRDLRTDRWEPVGEVPPPFRAPDLAAEVGASVQQRVDRGEPVPEWVAGPAVVREYARRGTRTGFTVLLTGLSGSGKSTVAKAVHAAILERTARTVTLLDGDVVRSMLSSELTFSRAHRELNVRRIGFVAAEVTRHGGIALCAPIAPYAASRDEVRAMISAHGGYLLVHVATPLATCEARDRKGLYAKARAGLIPEFTGVSDPYEEPADADLKIDTTTVSVPEAVELVLGLAVARGWLDGTAG